MRTPNFRRRSRTASTQSATDYRLHHSGREAVGGMRSPGPLSAGTMGHVTEASSAPAASGLDPAIAALLKRDAAGLLTAVIQEQATGEVLMVGWMDDEALHRTLTTGRTTFYSRSRQDYWVKGESSGNTQEVQEVRLDCDGDTVLVRVHQVGVACHTGNRTCFDARLLTGADLNR
jgi:phosphoribosyl-AMP cyclohydrolase